MNSRFLILAEGAFSPLRSKTANACIRYTPENVVAVIDSTRAGQTAQDVLGFGGSIPVVASLAEGLARKPSALLIGIAPPGFHGLYQGADIEGYVPFSALRGRAAQTGRLFTDRTARVFTSRGCGPA